MKLGCRAHGARSSARASHTVPVHRGFIWMFFFPEELYGDFEDLETGDMHKGESGPDTQVQLPGLTTDTGFGPWSGRSQAHAENCRS